ncbi:hypothetical protein HK096_000377, partial [Nowakowskiella sp. JEL0078]
MDDDDMDIIPAMDNDDVDPNESASNIGASKSEISGISNAPSITNHIEYNATTIAMS